MSIREEFYNRFLPSGPETAMQKVYMNNVADWWITTLTEKIEGMKLKEPFHDENSIVHNDALNAVLDLLTK